MLFEPMAIVANNDPLRILDPNSLIHCLAYRRLMIVRVWSPISDGAVLTRNWHRIHADWMAMLMPSAMIGCASPAALPTKKIPP